MTKSRLLVDVNQHYIDTEFEKVEKLNSEINRFYHASQKFRMDLPSSLWEIWEAVNSELVASAGLSIEAKPDKVAYLLGREQEYANLKDLWLSIEASPTLIKYAEYIALDGNKYAFKDELQDAIHEQACTYLENDKHIALYKMIMEFFELHEEIESAIGRGGEMSFSFRSKLAIVSELFRINNNFELLPDYSEIKNLIKN